MLLGLFQINADFEDLFENTGKKQHEWDLQSNIFSSIQKYERINLNNSNAASHVSPAMCGTVLPWWKSHKNIEISYWKEIIFEIPQRKNWNHPAEFSMK